MTTDSDQEETSDDEANHAPRFKGPAFTCPHCGVYAEQFWQMARFLTSERLSPRGIPPTPVPTINATGNRPTAETFVSEQVALSTCKICHEECFWHNTRLVWPEFTMTATPNRDLDQEIIADYREAASIVQRSPRGAAALLRLCIQKLCIQLQLPGKNIDQDRAALVARGLPAQIQQAMDLIRVIGNDAVHPGEMDLRDDLETALMLFEMVNVVAQVMITQPKVVAGLYARLPESKRNYIENDRPNKGQ